MLADTLTKAPDFIMFHDCTNFAECEALTKQAVIEHGIDYLPSDAGEWCSPRYGAVRTPQVGDAVFEELQRRLLPGRGDHEDQRVEEADRDLCRAGVLPEGCQSLLDK